MTKHRHGVLFTALTLVLGVALLSATFAAPRLRLVEGLEARGLSVGSVSNANGAVEQTITSAAAGNAAQGGASAQARPPALQSPARIVVKAPADIYDPTKYIDPNPPHQIGEVWEMEKDAANVPGSYDPDDATGRESWTQLAYLDIFSSINRDKVTVDDAITDTHGRVADYTPDNVIVPGSCGSYRFTVESPPLPLAKPGLVMGVDYDLTLSIGDDIEDDDQWEQFPIMYRLWDITDPANPKPIAAEDDGTYGDLTGAWTGWELGIDPVTLLPREYTKVFERHLGKEDHHSYQLDWKWDFEKADAATGSIKPRDDDDTALGMSVDDPEAGPPHYQVKLQMLMWAESLKVTVYFDVDPFDEGFDAAVSPESIEWEYGDRLVDPDDPSIPVLPIPIRRDIPPRTGLLGRLGLPGSRRSSYRFAGWAYDPLGDEMVLPDDLEFVVTQDITLYAIWTSVNAPCNPWWLLLIPPVLAAPLIPLIKLASLLPLALIPPALWWLLRDRPEPPPDEPTEVHPGEVIVKTGDSSAAMWSALTMLALSGSLALILSRKRREDED